MTPISRREPDVLIAPAGSTYAPAAPGRERATRQHLAKLAVELLGEQPSLPQRSRQHEALIRALHWLETFAGEDWQDRWLHSRSDQYGHQWLRTAHESIGIR